MRKFVIPAILALSAIASFAIAGANQTEAFPNPASFPALTVGGGGLTINGPLTRTGSSTSNGNATLNGDSGISGNESVGGSASFAGGACATDSSGNLTCQDAGFLGNETVSGTLTSTGAFQAPSAFNRFTCANNAPCSTGGTITLASSAERCACELATDCSAGVTAGTSAKKVSYSGTTATITIACADAGYNCICE